MKFDGSIIVIGDVGQLKAYRVSNVKGVDRFESMQVSHTQKRGTPKESTVMELIADYDYLESHGRISEKMSDKTGKLGNSSGEPHNMKLEQKKRALKDIGKDIGTLIVKESPAKWYLAFAKDSLNQLTEMLDPQVRNTLKKSIGSNLTKMDKNKILPYFE
jgi:hypothetical protein